MDSQPAPYERRIGLLHLMSDDQFWRTVLGGLAMGLIVAIKPHIGTISHRIGYAAGRLVASLRSGNRASQ